MARRPVQGARPLGINSCSNLRERSGPGSAALRSFWPRLFPPRHARPHPRHVRPPVRQRPAPPRPPRRRLPPGRPLLSATSGSRGRDVLYVCGSDEHGVADHAPRPRGGRRSAGHRGPLPRADRGQLRAPRHVVRLLRPNDLGHAPRDEPGLLPHALRRGRVQGEDGGAALRPRSRPLPRRPLRARDVPRLRLRGRLRRSVRELRLVALAEGPDRPAQRAHRRRARGPHDDALVPPPRRPPAPARSVDRRRTPSGSRTCAARSRAGSPTASRTAR